MKLFETRNETRPLSVLYTEDEVPMEGVVLQYDIIDLELPSVARFPTNASGRALTGPAGAVSIDLQVTDVAQARQFAVQVTTPGRVDVQPIFFDVVVSKRGLPPLTVIPVYPENGPQHDLVTEVQVLLYRQVEDPADPGNFLAGTVACDRLTPPVANDSQLPAGGDCLTNTTTTCDSRARRHRDHRRRHVHRRSIGYVVVELGVGGADGRDSGRVCGCRSAGAWDPTRTGSIELSDLTK